jgi:hypothetical protein
MRDGMSAGLVALFAPYCQGSVRPDGLQQALEQLETGEIRGSRLLRPSGERPFQLRWQAGVAPLEPAQLELLVGSDPGRSAGSEPEAHYRCSIATYQLVLWLMDWLAAGGAEAKPADLPESFWQWLLLGSAPPTSPT